MLANANGAVVQNAVSASPAKHNDSTVLNIEILVTQLHDSGHFSIHHHVGVTYHISKCRVESVDCFLCGASL